MPRHPPRALSSLTYIKARHNVARLCSTHVSCGRKDAVSLTLQLLRCVAWTVVLASRLHRRQLPVAGADCENGCGLSARAVAGAGGAEEIRTPDLRRAKAALSQLSYGPFRVSL